MNKEYFQILRQLEQHHSLFSRFWSIGRLEDNESIPTARIVFDSKNGDGIVFEINPTFWASCNFEKKVFVIAHECMHVYLEHGRRMRGMKQREANRAADIVNNHYLVDGFGFDREKFDWQNYCWLETLFPDDTTVKPNQCFEYYYQLLLKRKNEEGDPQTVDEHEMLGELSDEALQKIVGRLSQEELEEFESIIESTNDDESNQAGKAAGSTAGRMHRIIQLGQVVKKRKWETVVKDVLGRFCKEKDIRLEQWARHNRRLANFPSGSLSLPSEIEETIKYRDRIDVWFFQDTSSSCKHLADRFFRAAASLPDDKFRVRMFCFDTKVYETTLKSGRLYGFGGTHFSCIERRIQEIIKEEKGTLYPSVVFIVTDGDGNVVRPQHPERWHWFLSQNKTNLIPTKSRAYMLSDYE